MDELLCLCYVPIRNARYLLCKTLKSKYISCYEAVTEHFSLVYKESKLATECRATSFTCVKTFHRKKRDKIGTFVIP